MGLAGHMTRIVRERNAYRTLVGKTEIRRTLGKIGKGM